MNGGGHKYSCHNTSVNLKDKKIFFTLHLSIASEQAYGGQYPNLQKEEIDVQRIPQTYPWSHMGRYDGNSVLFLWKLSSFSCALPCFILPFPSLLPSSSLSTASLLFFFSCNYTRIFISYVLQRG